MITSETHKAPSASKRWPARIIATGTGAALIGAAIFGVTSASAATRGPSAPASGTPSSAAAGIGAAAAAKAGAGAGAGSAAAKSSAKAAGKHAKNGYLRHLARELRVEVQAKDNFGDRAHVLAFALISHPQAFAKLPQNLQADLKALEAAAAPDRDSAAQKIKDTALNGGYGDKIQKRAKAILARIAKAPAHP
ncbi:hypothetical protein IV498_01635 [Paenarthrobacter sp. Z7-10]|uniref:hypothetical protein n=1 Tax=Paenarthrobacter sp. Z7-10 TaxID=2787635 RepID=UPI0022A9CD64|nr:hypothetical protein [Paenarthrobacter sp. Z7-10]MCZ2401917.1 hypothetical protein [Paenarthrobacter sp. Z7-10]